MPCRHHLDYFARWLIIGMLEEGRQMKDIAGELLITHSIVFQLLKTFQRKGTCSRDHEGGHLCNTTCDSCRRQIYYQINKNNPAHRSL